MRNLGIVTKIFTGDSKEYAKVVAKEVGIEEVYSELLPQDKFKLLEEEIDKYDNHVAFVGDTIFKGSIGNYQYPQRGQPLGLKKEDT